MADAHKYNSMGMTIAPDTDHRYNTMGMVIARVLYPLGSTADTDPVGSSADVANYSSTGTVEPKGSSSTMG